MTVLFACNGAVVASFVARIPDVQTALGMSGGTLGLVLASISVGVLLGLVGAGRVVARTGSRRLVVLGASAAVLGLPLAGAAPSAGLLALALVALGTAGATMDVGVNALAVAIERSYRRSIIVSFHGAWSVGTLLGALGGSVATARALPVALHLLGVAVTIAVLAATALRWVRIDDRAPAADPGAAPPQGRAPVALPRGPLLPLALVVLAAALGESTAGQWSGIHLRDGVGVSTARIGWGYVAYTSAMVTVRLLGDRAARRFGAQTVVTGGGWLAAGGYLLLVAVPALPAALVGFVLIGLGLGAVVPLAFSRAGRLTAAPGEGVAAVATVGYLAFLVGPPVIGRIEQTLGLPVAFTLIAVVLVGLTSRRLPTG